MGHDAGFVNAAPFGGNGIFAVKTQAQILKQKHRQPEHQQFQPVTTKYWNRKGGIKQRRKHINQVLERRIPVDHRTPIAHLLRKSKIFPTPDLELSCHNDNTPAPTGALLNVLTEGVRRLDAGERL